MENITPEYQMAYFNNILLYYILQAVTNKQLAKDIWEEARKEAFPQCRFWYPRSSLRMEITNKGDDDLSVNYTLDMELWVAVKQLRFYK